MDRALSLGNSQDAFGRRALHVKLGNTEAEPIPVEIVGQVVVSSTPKYFDYSDETEPGETTLVFIEQVPAGKTWLLYCINVSCRGSGVLRVTKNDGEIIGTRRTGPGCPNADFQWALPRPILEGETVAVEFEALPGVPAQPIEAFLQVSEQGAAA
jgi:hypothetical protein